jgi:hypothetical protein
VDENVKMSQGKFKVSCKAGEIGYLEVASDSVGIRIGQSISRDGKEEMWESLQVTCNRQENGVLALEVVVFHPEWDEPLRIASIQSSTDGQSTDSAPLRCDLNHKQL